MPFIRAVGFGIVSVIVVLHDLRTDPLFPQPSLLLLVATDALFAASSWLVLRFAYGRTGRVDLSLIFLHLDVLVWLPMDDYLTKPVSSASLAAALQHGTGRRAPAPSATPGTR
ncbi:MAG TPA: hypothetical protein VNS61_17110 [Caldimonas sp.]|nr:hypothetical protein [Caldimonas sp.]